MWDLKPSWEQAGPANDGEACVSPRPCRSRAYRNGRKLYWNVPTGVMQRGAVRVGPQTRGWGVHFPEVRALRAKELVREASQSFYRLAAQRNAEIPDPAA